MFRIDNLRSWYFLLISSVLIVYSATFHYDWHFDDYRITDNPALQMEILSLESIKSSFYSDVFNNAELYRPIANLSFALNYFVHGLDIRGFRLVNILIHCSSTIFLFHFLRLALMHCAHSLRVKEQATIIAFFSALIWAIHPINIQAVVYIVQRMASLAGMLYIAAMYFYLTARLTSSILKRIFLGIICVCFVLLAIGSKENAIMLPVAILIFEIFCFRKNSFIHYVTIKNTLIFSGIIAVSVVFVVYNEKAFPELFIAFNDRPFTLAQRLLTEIRVVAFYIFQLLFPLPSNFSIEHHFLISKSLFDPFSTILAFVFLSVLFYGAFFLVKRFPLYSFSILFFFINHIIESSVLPLEIAFEHRNYIPGMFLFLPVVATIFSISSSCDGQCVISNKQIGYIAVSLLSGCILISSLIAIKKWENGYTLWSDAIQKNQQMIRPRVNLADWYLDNGKLAEAKDQLLIALELEPYHLKVEKSGVYSNLGVIYQRLGQNSQAEKYYLDSLSINPDDLTALSGLISVYSIQDKFDLADSVLKKIQHQNISDETINFNLGLYHLRRGNSESALSCLIKIKSQRLLQQSTQYIGIAYMQLERYNDALKVFSGIANTDIKNIRNSLHFADVLWKIGERDKAENLIEDSLSLLSSSEELKQLLNWLEDEHDYALKPDRNVLIPLIIKKTNNGKNQ